MSAVTDSVMGVTDQQAGCTIEAPFEITGWDETVYEEPAEGTQADPDHDPKALQRRD